MSVLLWEWFLFEGTRPDLRNREDIDEELQLEYHNAMLFASDKVLTAGAAFGGISARPTEPWVLG
jgi:hypothetical protein